MLVPFGLSSAKAAPTVRFSDRFSAGPERARLSLGRSSSMVPSSPLRFFPSAFSRGASCSFFSRSLVSFCPGAWLAPWLADWHGRHTLLLQQSDAASELLHREHVRVPQMRVPIV